MTLQSLLNKRVMAADSVCLGCIYDFRARGEEPEVVVTHVRVGGAAWAYRLQLDGIGRWLLRTAGELDLPWEAIAAGETRVSLKPGWDRARCEGDSRRADRNA